MLKTVTTIDEVGRIQLPLALIPALAGRSLVFGEDTHGRVFARLHEPGCVICGASEVVRYHEGRGLCRRCMFEILNA